MTEFLALRAEGLRQSPFQLRRERNVQLTWVREEMVAWEYFPWYNKEKKEG